MRLISLAHVGFAVVDTKAVVLRLILGLRIPILALSSRVLVGESRVLRAAAVLTLMNVLLI